MQELKDSIRLLDAKVDSILSLLDVLVRQKLLVNEEEECTTKNIGPYQEYLKREKHFLAKKESNLIS